MAWSAGSILTKRTSNTCVGAITELSGKRAVNGYFNVILRELKHQKTKRLYIHELGATSRSISVYIMCYRSLSEKPQWIDTEPDIFSAMCTVMRIWSSQNSTSASWTDREATSFPSIRSHLLFLAY